MPENQDHYTRPGEVLQVTTENDNLLGTQPIHGNEPYNDLTAEQL